MIRDEHMKVGDRLLSERDYADKWGVSRTSVREAFKALAYAGIIEVKHGSGTYLKEIPSYMQEFEFNKESFDKLDKYDKLKMRLEARLIFEPMVAELAAERIADEELEELEETLISMKKHIDMGDNGACGIDDMNFHYAYVKASQNYIIYRAMTEIWSSSAENYTNFQKIPELAQESYEQHLKLFDLFKKRDSKNIKIAMEKHILYSIEKNLDKKLKYENNQEK